MDSETIFFTLLIAASATPFRPHDVQNETLEMRVEALRRASAHMTITRLRARAAAPVTRFTMLPSGTHAARKVLPPILVRTR